MRLEMYSRISKFMDDVFDVLLENEAQNNLIVANCLQGRERSSNWFMAAIKDDQGAIKLVTLMTPPYGLCLYEPKNMQDESALDLFIKEIAALKMVIPHILAEKSLAYEFAEKYQFAINRPCIIAMKMRVFRCDGVKEIPLSPGMLRTAVENDMFFLPYWNVGFVLDIGEEVLTYQGSGVASAVQKVGDSLSAKALFIWENDFPVSQAAIGRRTLDGAVINAVYTPPHFRGHGYATSCVASLSRYLLDSGYKFCGLFADLANPISNRIYGKIGYVPVCDYDKYSFTPPQDI